MSPRIQTVPPPPRAPGYSLPSTPNVGLVPGEAVVGRYSSDPRADERVLRLDGLLGLVLILALYLPITVITALRWHLGLNPGDALLGLPIVLVALLIFFHARSAKRNGPSIAFVTNRRIIVERVSREPISASFPLENVGEVRVIQDTRLGRRATSGWLCLLPVGTTEAVIGAGVDRRVAPGVEFIPAMPLNQVQQMRDVASRVVRELRTRPRNPPQVSISVA